jgi:hypothetical protein
VLRRCWALAPTCQPTTRCVPVTEAAHARVCAPPCPGCSPLRAAALTAAPAAQGHLDTAYKQRRADIANLARQHRVCVPPSRPPRGAGRACCASDVQSNMRDEQCSVRAPAPAAPLPPSIAAGRSRCSSLIGVVLPRQGRPGATAGLRPRGGGGLGHRAARAARPVPSARLRGARGVALSPVWRFRFWCRRRADTDQGSCRRSCAPLRCLTSARMRSRSWRRCRRCSGAPPHSSLLAPARRPRCVGRRAISWRDASRSMALLAGCAGAVWSRRAAAQAAHGLADTAGSGPAAPARLPERARLPHLPQHAVRAARVQAALHARAGRVPRAAGCAPPAPAYGCALMQRRGAGSLLALWLGRHPACLRSGRPAVRPPGCRRRRRGCYARQRRPLASGILLALP